MNQTRTLVILLVVLLVISTAGMGMGVGMGPGMMGPGMMGGYWAGGSGAWWPAMILAWVGMLGFWAAVVVLGLLLVRWLAAPTQSGRRPEEDDALSILRRRYAAGEIDQETFERMKRELTP